MQRGGGDLVESKALFDYVFHGFKSKNRWKLRLNKAYFLKFGYFWVKGGVGYSQIFRIYFTGSKTTPLPQHAQM